MGTWKEMLANASTQKTLERAKSTLGKKTIYKLGKGGFDPTQPLTQQCDCSGFVAWCVGVPRELPPGSNRWLCTDTIWQGGGAVGDGLFDRRTPANAQPGDIYVYPDSGGHQGHVGIITETDNRQPTKVIHCSAVAGDAIRITSPTVFSKNPKSRIVAVDYNALRMLFSIESEKQCRLILAKWSGDEKEPFIYKWFTQASLREDHFCISPSYIADWLGRVDNNTKASPITDILKVWKLDYWTDLDHMQDADDPRVYVFIPEQKSSVSTSPAVDTEIPSSGEGLRHSLLTNDTVLRKVVSERIVLKPTGGQVDGCGAVQNALNYLAKVYPEYGIDLGSGNRYQEFYGPKTAQAIKNFQAAHNIQPNGYIGHDTLLALDAALLAYDANSQVDTTRVESDTNSHVAAEDFRTIFIRNVISPAQSSQRETGVPASVSIAQAILESDWGRSQLSYKVHNYFGIKGTGPAGSICLPTYEYENGKRIQINANFRAYHDLEECFKDHGSLIAFKKWSNGQLIYAKAMKYTGNPQKFAEALEGVYATDPNYAESLISLMERYKLRQYDI